MAQFRILNISTVFQPLSLPKDSILYPLSINPGDPLFEVVGVSFLVQSGAWILEKLVIPERLLHYPIMLFDSKPLNTKFFNIGRAFSSYQE